MLLPCRGVRIHGTYINPPRLLTMRTTVGSFEIETLTGLYGEPLDETFLNLLSRDDLYRHSLIRVFLLSNMNPPHLLTMCPTVGSFESNERTGKVLFFYGTLRIYKLNYKIVLTI